MRKKENLIQENLICTNHPSYCHSVGKSSMISSFKKSPPYSIYALTCACTFTSTKYNIKKKNPFKEYFSGTNGIFFLSIFETENAYRWATWL